MPGNVAGLTNFALDIFGGLVTNMTPQDLPAGVSPECQDVQFFTSGVGSRPGTTSIYAPIAGNPTVNYIKTYITQTEDILTMILDSLGNLWQEDADGAPGVLGLVKSDLGDNRYNKSVTAFTREYMAISDGKFGTYIPLQYDTTNLDRVSQVGPGAGPTVADNNLFVNITSITQPAGVAISSISSDSFDGIWNVVTAAPHGLTGIDVTIAGTINYNGTFFSVTILSPTSFTIGATSFFATETTGTTYSTIATVTTATPITLTPLLPIVISGATVTAYNGNHEVLTVISPTVFTFDAVAGNLGSSGAAGTIDLTTGNITAGVHQVVVIFVTRQGYFTAPSPPVSWTAAGSLGVSVTNIPTGPSNVVARIVAFTAANLDNFYYSPITDIGITQMIINDNTTTSASFDFTDEALIASANVDDLFDELELGECAGVIDYSSRLFWWGQRNKITNFINLTFDGGWNLGGAVGGGDLPLGWMPDQTNGIDGEKNSVAVVWGDAYQINSDLAATVTGQIFQSAYQDFNGVQILSANTGYSFRVRLRYGAGGPIPVGPSFFVQFQSASTSFTIRGGVNASLLTDEYQEFTGIIGDMPAVIPTDLQLTIYVNWISPVTGKNFLVDCLEIFPTSQPNLLSTVQASYSSERVNVASGPESYSGVTGFLNVNENNDLAVRAAFKLRGNLYFVKERGLYQTQDDGINEPNQWTITELSKTVGTVSVNGVAVGEDWAVIVDRSGLYIFWGGEPIKISEELQVDAAGLGRVNWSRINWDAGETIWITVDTIKKQILLGLPLDDATSPNITLYMSYIGLMNAEAIAQAPPVHVSVYSGKVLVVENSRKWSPWTGNTISNYCALVERNDGTARIFFGNSAGNGKVYELDETNINDDEGDAAVPIASEYIPHFFFDIQTEQQLQLGPNRKLFQYLTMYIQGMGAISLTGEFPGDLPQQPLATLPLVNPAAQDTELPINMTAERASIRFNQNALDNFWIMSKFSIFAKQSPTMGVRGRN